MMKFFKRNKKGFSLAELIVVIAILGILAAIVVPRVVENTDQARIAHDRATLRTVQGAVNMFHAQNGRYPGVRPNGTVIEGYAYINLADHGEGNLQKFLDLGTSPVMPAARSRTTEAVGTPPIPAGTLRVFRYNPATGAVTIDPALPAVN